jgi:competence protein ComEA
VEVIPRPEPETRRDVIAERWQRLRSDPRVGVAVLACVAIAAGVAWFRSGIAPASPPPAPDTEVGAAHAGTTTTAPDRSTTSSTVPSVLVVDVAGAVVAPRVVTLPAGARVIDAIDAAGGAQPGADLSRLNLAAPLADGSRVAVPMVGQPTPALDPTAVSGAPSPAAGRDSGAGADDGKVNVNTADAEALEALPGVGPATAAAIVQERESNGPFATIDDLDRVPGIGPAKLEQLRPMAEV